MQFWAPSISGPVWLTGIREEQEGVVAQVVPDLRRRPDYGAPDSLLLLWLSRTRTFSWEEIDPTGMLLQRPAKTFPRIRVVFLSAVIFVPAPPPPVVPASPAPARSTAA